MDYCKDAYKILGVKIVCGTDCPIYGNCPRTIMEDATDGAITKAIEAMLKAIDLRVSKYKRNTRTRNP